MRMTHFIVREAILPELQALTKAEVVEELVNGLHEAGQLPSGELQDIVTAVLRREQLGSTGIGRNIAIPHTRHPSVNQLVGTVGISRAGIAFDSIDSEPVHVVVLLISPQDRPGDHLRALENVVQTMRDEEFVKALRNVQSKDQLWNLISGTRTSL